MGCARRGAPRPDIGNLRSAHPHPAADAEAEVWCPGTWVEVGSCPVLTFLSAPPRTVVHAVLAPPRGACLLGRLVRFDS
jgi:hypothetical protein